MSKNKYVEKLKFYISILSSYRKKIIQIFFFEIFYTLKFKDNFYKIHNSKTQTDSLPCTYYFLSKISNFINSKSLSKIIDLGSGTGRIVNFLAYSTKAKVIGYEIDSEVISYAKSKKNKNSTFVKKNINLIDFSKADADCYIFNIPLQKEKDIRKLIKKIELGRKKYKKEYFLVVINIDSHLINIKLKDIFRNFKIIEFIEAGKVKTLRIYQNKI
jgi:SAM-dependent methyltransferase|tara:strand:+ start:1143 stop:1787 length:645 start_codon:yes stop_codon:yes gene_type:complete